MLDLELGDLSQDLWPRLQVNCHLFHCSLYFLTKNVNTIYLLKLEMEFDSSSIKTKVAEIKKYQ